MKEIITQKEQVTKELVIAALKTMGLPTAILNNKDLITTFINLCVSEGLNPIKKEIYAIPYKNPRTGIYTMTTVVDYKVYLERAYLSNDIEIPPQTTILNPKDAPIDWVVEYKAKRRSHSETFKKQFYFKEFTKNSGVWVEKPAYMIEKVALANGTKMLFPEYTKNLPFVMEEQWEKEVIQKVEPLIKEKLDEND